MSRARRRELLTLIANAISELANLDAEAAPAFYASNALPPDVQSRAVFARVCRAIPEARRQGKTWVVPRDAWERARSPKRAVRRLHRDELRAAIGIVRRAA